MSEQVGSHDTGGLEYRLGKALGKILTAMSNQADMKQRLSEGIIELNNEIFTGHSGVVSVTMNGGGVIQSAQIGMGVSSMDFRQAGSEITAAVSDANLQLRVRRQELKLGPVAGGNQSFQGVSRDRLVTVTIDEAGLVSHVTLSSNYKRLSLSALGAAVVTAGQAAVRNHDRVLGSVSATINDATQQLVPGLPSSARFVPLEDPHNLDVPVDAVGFGYSDYAYAGYGDLPPEDAPDEAFMDPSLEIYRGKCIEKGF